MITLTSVADVYGHFPTAMRQRRRTQVQPMGRCPFCQAKANKNVTVVRGGQLSCGRCGKTWRAR